MVLFRTIPQTSIHDIGDFNRTIPSVITGKIGHGKLECLTYFNIILQTPVIFVFCLFYKIYVCYTI